MNEALIRVIKKWVGSPLAMCWVVLTFFCNMSLAQDFGVKGTTYDIEEQSLLDFIMERLTFLESRGLIAKKQEELLARAKQTVANPTPVKGIARTEKPRTFFYDPTIILQKDLRTENGTLIHKAGTHFNPADHLPFRKTVVFFDATDQDQMIWIKDFEKTVEGPLVKILIKGSIKNLMEEWEERLYFDQQGIFVARLGIQQVPAIVTGAGRQLRIEEVVP